MATYKLTGKRYLKKYTATGVTPVYAANVDAILCNELMNEVKWEAVSEAFAGMTLHTNEVVDESTGVTGLDRNVEIRNSFDAALFCAEHVSGMHRAYANAACYVFELPEMETYPELVSIKARVTSDPYNSGGVRLAVHLADSLDIPLAMAELREGVAHVAGAVPREERMGNDKKIYWYPRTAEVSIPASAVVLKKYVMLYVGLENYALSRGDWLEGSAYISPTVEIETSGELSGWDSGSVVGALGEMLVCKEDFLPIIGDDLSIPLKTESTEAPVPPSLDVLAAALAGDYYFGGSDNAERGNFGSPHELTLLAYRAFYEDRMERARMDDDYMYPDLNISGWPGSGAFGASFSAGVYRFIRDSNLLNAIEGCIYRKKVLIPFVLPPAFSPRRMSLSWTASDACSVETGTPILRNVWIARGKRRVSYAAEDLQRHELYDCCVDKVGEWELVASLRRSVGDVCAGLEVELPFDIGADMPHTLLLTCYIDIGEFKNFTPGVSATDAKGRALGAGMAYNYWWYSFMLPGGWMPEIKLKV